MIASIEIIDDIAMSDGILTFAGLARMAEETTMIDPGLSGKKVLVKEGPRHRRELADRVDPHMGHSVLGRPKAEQIAREVRDTGRTIDLVPGDLLASEQARWITGQVIQVAGEHAL